MVQGQPRQKVTEIPSQKTRHPGTHLHTSSYTIDENKRITVWSQPLAKTWHPIWKITKANRAGGMTQVVQCLSSKCKGLISNSSTAKKKKINKLKINWEYFKQIDFIPITKVSSQWNLLYIFNTVSTQQLFWYKWRV
jgi:hypothetical protein